MPDSRGAAIRAPLARYAMAAMVVTVSFPLRSGLVHSIGTDLPPFIFLYPAVMMAAVLGGLGPGLVATALAVLCADYFILPPYNQFGITRASDAISLTVFAAMGALMSLLAERHQRSLLSIAAYKEEQALWASNEKLDVALASMTDAVFISDAKGQFIQFNDAFASFHKFADKTTCARTLTEYPEFLEVSMADGQLAPLEMWAVPRALRGETVANEEYCLRRKDTGESWIGSYSFAPVRDHEGAIIGSVVVGRDITERKIADQKLRESEASLAVAQARARLGSWEADLATWQAKWSAEMSHLYYRNPSSAAPAFEEFIEMVHPEDREVLVSQRDHISDFGDSFEFESRTNPSIGPMRHLNNTLCVVRNAAGIPVRLGGTAQDITARKRAEEALRKSETLYHGLFDSMDEGFCIIEMIFDAEGKAADYRFLEINAAFERQTGMHDAVGKRMREIAPSHEEFWFEIYGKIALEGEPAQFIHQAEALNRSFDIRAYRVGEPEQRRVAVVFNDISVRMRTEEALKQSMGQLRIFVEHAPASLAMFDRDMRYICASRRWSGDYGLGERDLLGISHYDIFPEIPERWKEAHRRARAGEVVQAEDDSFVRADGSLQRLRWEIHPWHEPSGGIGGIVVFTEDITERKRAEQHIQQLNRVYTVLSDINQTIVREKDSQRMLESACRLAVEKGKFRMAWIGMVDPETQKLEPIASSGKVDGYLDRVQINLLDPETETGPVATCLRTGMYSTCGDIEHQLFRPWSSDALRQGFRSVAAFPLRCESHMVGVLCLYAGELAFFDDDEIKVLDEMAMDISYALEVNLHDQDRRKAEDHVRQLNRVYAVLSQINETIVREKDSQALLETACRIAVEKGRFLMAWVGMINPSTLQVDPIASSADKDGYLHQIRIDFNNPEAKGPTANCLRSGHHAICNDIDTDSAYQPWRANALSCGYRSSAAFPLKVDGETIGVFCLYADQPGFFVGDELLLLDEMAMDISFALEVNRHEEERRKGEEELRRRTAFLEALVESALDSVLVIDSQGKKILQNQRLIDMLKIPPAIAANSDFFPQLEYVKSVMKNPEQFIEKAHYLVTHLDEVCRDEVEMADGTILDRYSAPVKDKAQKYYGRIWTLRDITERRQLEAQFRQAQKMEAIGQLTGGIAHDFNNLLTVILGCSEIISEEAHRDPRIHKMAEMVRDAAQRGADLTHRMLAFARRQALQPRSVNINQLLMNMESFLRRTLSADIELSLILAAEDCCATIDPTQLESALLNLCVNARDAMPNGGKLTIESRTTELDPAYADQNSDVTAGQYILVAVSDTGCGISEENLRRVFEPFFTTKGVGKGTGLGLSMVYGFAKQSQGHLKIYSEPERGTSVKLYLPHATQKTEPSTPEQSSLASLQGSEVILLVEDNDAVREFAKSQLVDLGYRVFEAANGNDALKVLAEHQGIDLLFTDLVIPGGLNGRQLAQQASLLKPELKVLYCSGYAESAVHHQGWLNKEIQLLNKPYTRLELARRVRGALG